MKLVDGFPRRCRIDLQTPAEAAIRAAMDAVEHAGCHPLLTDAVVLLDKAREKVGDFVDLSVPTLIPPIPADLDAAIEFLKTQPLRQDAEKLSESAFGGGCHFSVGMHLRNTWGLWHNSVLAQWFKAFGIHHADDMSGIILNSFWRAVNHKPVDFAGQVAYYREFWKKQGLDPDNL